jgi:hypothetical protein
MIESIGHEIAERIREKPWADRVAGIVRLHEYPGPDNKPLRVPLSCDVTGKDCNETELSYLLPDQRRRSIIFIEDRTGSRRIGLDGQYIQFQSVIRVCGWINPILIGQETPECNGCTSASRISREIYALLPNRNENLPACNVTRVNFQYYGLAPVEESPWKRYTLAPERVQYLMPPFQFFCMDLVCTWCVHEQCLCPVEVGDPSGCGAPPVVRRRFPKDFTCDELNDPVTGLTAEQRADCLDCSGSTMSIIHKADLDDMLADDTTVPTLQDIVVNDATKDTYYGAPPLTIKGLAEAKKYTLGVEHVNEGDADEGLNIAIGTSPKSLQINDPLPTP